MLWYIYTQGDNELSVELVCRLLTGGVDQEYVAALQQVSN